MKESTMTSIKTPALAQGAPDWRGMSMPKVAIVDMARNIAKTGSPLVTKRDKVVAAVI